MRSGQKTTLCDIIATELITFLLFCVLSSRSHRERCGCKPGSATGALCSSTDPRDDLHVLFDLFWGGIQACGITFGTLAQAARIPGLPVGTQNSMALEVPRHGEKPQRAGTVTNLPSLNVRTWDGRSSLVACARCTFVTFVDATIRT